MSMTKQRLDLVLLDKGIAESRQKARALIMAGRILVNNVPVEKPGTKVLIDDDIILKGKNSPFVSRGGIKLEAALKSYDMDVSGMTCLDVGASTGGFTDCLLKHGAAYVYTVDVGYGQLAWKLRQDKRVAVIERMNIRHIKHETIGMPVDLITIDTSFISLKIVVPAVFKFMKKSSKIIALIKPQFEVGKGKVGKGGVVKDTLQHSEVIKNLILFFDKTGLLPHPVISSPIQGPKGNKEFLILLENNGVNQEY